MAVGAALLLVHAWHSKALPSLLLAGAAASVGVAVALPRLASFASAVSAAAFSLTLVEGALALVQGGPPQPTYEPADYYAASDLGYGLTPGAYVATRLSAAGEMIYKVPYTIGADGFRVTPHPQSVTGRRVNLFGGSFTFGEGVADDETVAARLAARLEGVDAKNFGVHGYGVNQAVAILESDRDTHGEVNILMTFSGHAVRSACRPSYQVGAPRYQLNARGEAERSGRCFAALDNPLGRILKKSQIFALVEAFMAERYRQEDLRLYAALVDKFVSLSLSRGQTPVIAFLPNMGYSQAHEDAQAELMRCLKAKGMIVVDATLLDATGTLGSQYVLHPADGHPSALAHEKRADLLAALLRALL